MCFCASSHGQTPTQRQHQRRSQQRRQQHRHQQWRLSRRPAHQEPVEAHIMSPSQRAQSTWSRRATAIAATSSIVSTKDVAVLAATISDQQRRRPRQRPHQEPVAANITSPLWHNHATSSRQAKAVTAASLVAATKDMAALAATLLATVSASHRCGYKPTRSQHIPRDDGTLFWLGGTVSRLA